MNHRKPVFNTDRNLRHQYLLNVFNYVLNIRRHDLKWIVGEALEPFDRESCLKTYQSYPKQKRLKHFRNATQLYYLHKPYNHDCWNEGIGQDNWIIYYAEKFRETLDELIDVFDSDGTLDEIFKYKNPYKVLEMYCRAVLAYPTESAVYVLGSLVISNPKFLPDAIIDIFDEGSICEFHQKISHLKDWFFTISHYSKFPNMVNDK